jgi:hypothetical protein
MWNARLSVQLEATHLWVSVRGSRAPAALSGRVTAASGLPEPSPPRVSGAASAERETASAVRLKVFWSSDVARPGRTAS